MKAAVLQSPGNLVYGDWREPQAGPGQVKIKVKCAGICGSDIPRVLRGAAHSYPIVLGHEFSGIITETGEGVSDGLAGKRAACAPLLPCMSCRDCRCGNYALCGKYGFIGSRQQGGFAEYVCLPEENAVPFGDGIGFEQGAMFEPSTVALHGLRRVNYTGGKNVCILGGGTIGLFTMQWAKIFGAAHLTVFDISNKKLTLAKKMGADETINPSVQHYRENFYDYVFETAGSVETMRMSFVLAAKKASVCFIGTPANDLSYSPKEFEEMHRKEFTLTGSWMSYSAPFPGEEWTLTADAFASGKLRFDPEMIHRVFPLSEAAQAFEMFKNPADVKGKIMIGIG
ncbi:MAG: galactitol-1-phosphate 5-dehydrogenase [Defluviitaleaceae bacterium]|nr:galactitol-1-phosphate 5-dehydrogenase [Defluviitaleaceae bacterium]